MARLVKCFRLRMVDEREKGVRGIFCCSQVFSWQRLLEYVCIMMILDPICT